MQRRSAITLTSGKSQANLIWLIQSFAFIVFVQVYNIMYKRSGDLLPWRHGMPGWFSEFRQVFFVYLLRVSATSDALFIPLSLLVATTRELCVLLLFLLSFLFPRSQSIGMKFCRPLRANFVFSRVPWLWTWHCPRLLLSAVLRPRACGGSRPGPGEARRAQASQIVVRPQSLTGPQIQPYSWHTMVNWFSEKLILNLMPRDVRL